MAIEAEHYRRTRAELAADPIIQVMAAELALGIRAGHLTRDDVDAWSFTVAALSRYHEQGGTIDTHIGGPAEAIRALLDAPVLTATELVREHRGSGYAEGTVTP